MTGFMTRRIAAGAFVALLALGAIGSKAASSSVKASAAYTASFCVLGTDVWQAVKPKFICPA